MLLSRIRNLTVNGVCKGLKIQHQNEPNIASGTQESALAGKMY